MSKYFILKMQPVDMCYGSLQDERDGLINQGGGIQYRMLDSPKYLPRGYLKPIVKRFVMNREALRDSLNELGIPSNYYNLEGNSSTEILVLEQYGGLWKVYYVELRGEKRLDGLFLTEEEACQFIYNHYLELKAWHESYGLHYP